MWPSTVLFKTLTILAHLQNDHDGIKKVMEVVLDGGVVVLNVGHKAGEIKDFN